MLALVSGSPTAKVRNLGLIGFVTGFISFFLIFRVNSELGLIKMTILYGLTNSVLYPLILTIPGEFGYKISIR